MAGKPPRRLSAGERALWDQVRRSATPMRPEPLAPDPLPPATPVTGRKRSTEDTHPDLQGVRIEGGKARPGNDILPPLSDRLAAEPVRMDHKAFRRMKRGRLRIEGRLDLHGSTLADAEPRLRRFLLAAHADGKRLVVVITGKGRERDDDWPMPSRRGILKHQVPLWLRGGALAGVVLQVTEAHRSHGGSGAYYVYLRR